jgi:integrase
MGVTVREKPKGSGVWWVFINEKGERQAKRIGSKTAATKVQKEIEVELARDAFHIGRRDIPTLAQYAEGWLENVVAETRKQNTYRAYKIIVNAHLVPALGSRRLDEITPKDVSDFVVAKKKAGLKTATVNGIKNCLGAMFKRAIHPDGYIKDNPARGVEVPRRPDEEGPKEADPFDFDERDILEATFKQDFPAYYPMIVCAFRTGLRPGELIALQWGDIQWPGRLPDGRVMPGTLTVRRNMTTNRVTTPKSKTSRREVRMTSGLVEVLEKHRRDVIEKTLRKGWGEVPEWVFPAEEGGHIHYARFLTKVWNKAMTKSKLRRRTPHDCRHTYASLRLAQGHPLAEVSKEMGHASADVTFKTYYKHMPRESATNIDELDGRKRSYPHATPAQPKGVNS